MKRRWNLIAFSHSLQEIGIETQRKHGSHAHKHPRLPLLMRHNQYVKTILERVQENLDSMG